MKSFAAPLVLVVLGLSSFGCTIKTTSSGSDDDSADKTAPETNALFSNLPAATPDKFRGVWGLTFQEGDAQADVRFKFTDGKIIGGVSCSKGGTEYLRVGGSVDITTGDLDKKTGSFTMAKTLLMSKKDDKGRTCTGSLDGSTWEFDVAGKHTNLISKNPKGQAALDKLGD